MRLIIEEFWLQKHGNEPGEYEDAFDYDADWNILPDNTLRYRCAVADGATESVLSGRWANLLVQAFIGGAFANGVDQATLKPWQNKWQEQLPSGTIPWYLEDKFKEGAYAALAGLTLICDPAQPNQGLAKLRAVGDSCIFRIRDQQIWAFPLKKSTDFNTRPQLLGTANRAPQGMVKATTWDWHSNDIFLLMTDALAAWFLRKQELGEAEPWKCFEQPGPFEEAMYNCIRCERDAHRLKNDDVTLLKISLPRSSADE